MRLPYNFAKKILSCVFAPWFITNRKAKNDHCLLVNEMEPPFLQLNQTQIIFYKYSRIWWTSHGCFTTKLLSSTYINFKVRFTKDGNSLVAFTGCCKTSCLILRLLGRRWWGTGCFCNSCCYQEHVSESITWQDK